MIEENRHGRHLHSVQEWTDGKRLRKENHMLVNAEEIRNRVTSSWWQWLVEWLPSLPSGESGTHPERSCPVPQWDSSALRSNADQPHKKRGSRAPAKAPKGRVSGQGRKSATGLAPSAERIPESTRRRSQHPDYR